MKRLIKCNLMSFDICSTTTICYCGRIASIVESEHRHVLDLHVKQDAFIPSGHSIWMITIATSNICTARTNYA